MRVVPIIACLDYFLNQVFLAEEVHLFSIILKVVSLKPENNKIIEKYTQTFNEEGCSSESIQESSTKHLDWENMG